MGPWVWIAERNPIKKGLLGIYFLGIKCIPYDHFGKMYSEQLPCGRVVKNIFLFGPVLYSKCKNAALVRQLAVSSVIQTFRDLPRRQGWGAQQVTAAIRRDYKERSA